MFYCYCVVTWRVLLSDSRPSSCRRSSSTVFRDRSRRLKPNSIISISCKFVEQNAAQQNIQ